MPSLEMPSFLVLQLADAAFPTGGFAHSAGLEAAIQTGEVGPSGMPLEEFVEASLWSVGTSQLPFVAAAHAGGRAALPMLDAETDARLTPAVANRASRTQGRAFVGTSARIFTDHAEVRAIDEDVRARRIAAHLAPASGAILAAVGLTRDDALVVYVHAALRGVLSAAVRLGAVGPHEAQRVQLAMGAVATRVIEACAARGIDDAASASPWLDLVGATHERLYTRLFQS